MLLIKKNMEKDTSIEEKRKKRVFHKNFLFKFDENYSFQFMNQIKLSKTYMTSQKQTNKKQSNSNEYIVQMKVF